MRTRAAFQLVLASLLVAVALPGGARADHGAGCGTPAKLKTTGTTRCTFDFRGFPLSVEGTAEAIAGNAELRVWVTTPDLQDHVLVECRTSGASKVACKEAIDLGRMLDLLHPLQALYCHVTIKGHGIYWCQSGRGF